MSPRERAAVRPCAQRINNRVADSCVAEVAETDVLKRAAFVADGEEESGQGAEELERNLEEDHEEVEPEEVQPVKSAPSPEMPSPAEVEAHRETHLPYRSWCIDCVLGRAIGQMHKRIVGEAQWRGCRSLRLLLHDADRFASQRSGRTRYW